MASVAWSAAFASPQPDVSTPISLASASDGVMDVKPKLEPDSPPTPESLRSTSPPPAPEAGPSRLTVVRVKRAKRGQVCLRCRRQKSRCDGFAPCIVCVTHGAEDECIYKSGYNPPSASSRGRLSKSESDDGLVSPEELLRLKAALDKFQDYVGIVSPGHASPGARSLRDFKVPLVPLDLEVDCIAGAFGRMLHQSNWGEYCREGERSQLVAEGRKLLLTPASANHLEWSSEAPISNPVPNPTNIEESIQFVYGVLPTANQAAPLTKLFFARYNWMLFPVQPQRFLKDCQASFGRPPEMLSWHFIAVLLAVCRIGLGAATPENTGTAELADPATRTAMGDLWLRAALRALDLGDSDANPTLESFRAMLLIIFGFMFLGESSDAAGLRSLMQLHQRAIQMAFLLHLHRDPAKIPRRQAFSRAEEADRRSLWWALKVLGSMLGNASGIFSVIINDAVADVELPTEPQPPLPGELVACPCGGICAPWNPTTGLRSRYLLGGKLTGALTTLPFRRTPPATYREVMELHGRMAAVLDELPAILKVRIDGHKVDPRSLASCRLVAQMQISFQLHFHYLMLRLHRPVHTLLDVHAANVPFHREIVIRTARTLLSLRRVARIGPEAVLPGTFFVAAAVSLVVDGIQQPTRSNMASAEAAELRQEVDELLTDFLAEAKAPVLRRGKRVLEFLLGRFDAQLADGIPRLTVLDNTPTS